MSAVITAVVASAVIGAAVSTKNAKDGAKATAKAAERIEQGEARAVQLQLAAEKESRGIQERAAGAAAEFQRTGSAIAKDALVNLSNEMDNLIDQASNAGEGIINEGFSNQLQSIRTGFDEATGNITQSFSQALNTQTQGAQKQIGALNTGVDKAIQSGEAFVQAGTEGVSSFQDSALNPESALFQRRLDQGQKSLNEQLAARGQFNSGAAIQAQSDFISQATAEEQERQVGRQLQLAQLGQPSVSTQQQLQAGQGEQVGNILGQEAQNVANIQVGRGTNLSNLALNEGETVANLEGNQSSSLLGLSGNKFAQDMNRANSLNTGIANLATSEASNLANLKTGLGATNAASVQRGGDAQATSAQNIANTQANSILAQANIKATRNSQYAAQAQSILGAYSGGGGGNFASLAKNPGSNNNSGVNTPLATQTANYYNQPTGTGTVLRR